MSTRIPDDQAADPTPRWPNRMAWLAPLTAILLPGLTARRLDRVPLALAWAAHVLTVLASLAVVFLWVVWIDRYDGGGVAGYLATVWESLLELPDGWQSSSWENRWQHTSWEDRLIWLGEVIVVGLAIELGTMLGAFVMMSWCARVEPWRRTYRRTLARVWLTLSHVWVYLIPLWLITVGLESAKDVWRQHNSPFDYGEAPWWYRDSAIVLINAWCVAIGAYLIVMLWVLAGGRWRAHCRWPAGCEGCGYSLMGQRADAACPECGRPVAASTTDSPRCRDLLPRRRRWVLIDWLINGCLAIVGPGRLGRRLRVLTYAPGRGWPIFFTATGIVGVTLAVFVAMTLLTWYQQYHEYSGSSSPDWSALMFGGAVTSLTTSGLALLIGLGGAALAGTLARMFTGRNVMTLSVQGALCLSPWFVAWVGLFWLLFCALYILFEMFGLENQIQQRWGFDVTALLLGCIFLLHAIMLVIYLFLITRLTWVGRHANT